MKKTSIRLVLALGLFATTFGACKKDKDGNGVEITKENLVGTYKLTKAKYTMPIVGEMDYLALMDDCEKDDTYTLKADFSATKNDVGTKCNPVGNASITWTLAEQTIMVDTYGGKIKSFDGTTLTIEGSESQQGMTVSYSIVFVKQ
ncbi:MAG: lipocalin family protein [Niastella sp.]|nr:lipocalin family protein [Niastella sp.]